MIVFLNLLYIVCLGRKGIYVYIVSHCLLEVGSLVVLLPRTIAKIRLPEKNLPKYAFLNTSCYQKFEHSYCQYYYSIQADTYCIQQHSILSGEYCLQFR